MTQILAQFASEWFLIALVLQTSLTKQVGEINQNVTNVIQK